MKFGDPSSLHARSREARPHWAPGLIAVLLLAAAVRLAPALLVEHISPDAVEFIDIARHWQEAGKPLLSVKAYYYEQTPIVHYGGYERPLLPAVLLGIGARFGPTPAAGAQWVSFAASLLMILLLVVFLRRIYGAAPAHAAGLMIALSPIVLTASLFPWADMLSLLLVILTFLIPSLFDRLDSASPVDAREMPAVRNSGFRDSLAELLTGCAIGLAAAMRSMNLVMILPLAIYFVWTRCSMLSRLRGVILMLIGPAAFLACSAAVNLQNGAPALMMPQGFLYRTMRFDDGIYYWGQRNLSASALEFMRANAPAIVRQVVKQTIAYLYILLFYHQWLFVWWLALPLVCVRLWRRQVHPLIVAALLTGLLNLAIYCISWSTYDPGRFLLIPVVLLLSVCVCEAWRTWQKVGVPVGPVLRLSLVRVLLAGTAIAWGLLAARESYTAVRFYQASERFVAYGDSPLWNDPKMRQLARWLRTNMPPQAAVASPHPWALNYLTGLPTTFWPSDLGTPDKISEYLRDYPVSAVVFDPGARAADPSLAILRNSPGWREQAVGRFVIFRRQ